MNKAELFAAIAAITGETKKGAEAAVNAFVETVSAALVKGDKVQLVGFGSFEVRKRAFAFILDKPVFKLVMPVGNYSA
jgi:DNA-binding protein HU-beta